MTLFMFDRHPRGLSRLVRCTAGIFSPRRPKPRSRSWCPLPHRADHLRRLGPRSGLPQGDV